MNQPIRVLLTFLAAMTASVAAADPFGLPTWGQVLIAGLAAGFAAIGIIPPTMRVTTADQGRTVVATRPKGRSSWGRSGR